MPYDYIGFHGIYPASVVNVQFSRSTLERHRAPKKRYLQMPNILLIRKAIVCTVLLMGMHYAGFSQQAIELTNVKIGKKKIIVSGHRVEFRFKEKPNLRLVGRIKAISDSGFTVGDATILFSELKAIGRRRKGTGFLAYMSGLMGTGIIISAFSNDDPCPDCIDTSSSDQNYTALEVGFGVTILTLGVINSLNNTSLDIEEKWRLAVIDQPVKK